MARVSCNHILYTLMYLALPQLPGQHCCDRKPSIQQCYDSESCLTLQSERVGASYRNAQVIALPVHVMSYCSFSSPPHVYAHLPITYTYSIHDSSRLFHFRIKIGKSSMCSPCSHIRLDDCTWAMCECIRSVTSLATFRE